MSQKTGYNVRVDKDLWNDNRLPKLDVGGSNPLARFFVTSAMPPTCSSTKSAEDPRMSPFSAELVTELVSRYVAVTSYRVPGDLFTTCKPHFQPKYAYTVLCQYGLCGDNRLPKLDVHGVQ